MTIAETVRAGLGYDKYDTTMDDVLLPKIEAVKGFMTNAGVSEGLLSTPAGTQCILIGVTDLWNLGAGEIKFSPVFLMLTEQLRCKANV